MSSVRRNHWNDTNAEDTVNLVSNHFHLEEDQRYLTQVLLVCTALRTEGGENTS